MSGGSIKSRTASFNLGLINFDFPNWGDEDHKNWKIVDAALVSAGAVGISGVWENATAYVIGDRLVDPDTNNLYLCEVAHTSASTGTFAADRTANPTYWELISSLPVWRGTWTTATNYTVGDIVLESTYKYYFCVAVHTSSALFATDSANWQLIFDGTVTVNAAAAAQTAAETAAVNAGIAAASSEGSIAIDNDNRIINGDFGIWQRGTSHSTSGYGSADRWINSVAGGTVTMSLLGFVPGDTLGGNLSRFFLRQAVSGQSAASDAANIQQRIESVRSYAGQTITLLGWARRVAGAGNIVVEAIQNFGSGGSPSTTVDGIGVSQVTLSGVWAPFAVTMTIPSISGKTLGTNENDLLQLNFWTSAGSNFNARTGSLGIQTITVDLWGIHIRRGVVPASASELYRPRLPGVELALCQRYYQIHRLGQQFHSSVTGSVLNISRSFINSMRATPSYSGTGISNVGVSAFSVTPQSAEMFDYSITANGTGATSYIVTARFDAEL